MQEKEITIRCQVYTDVSELDQAERNLIEEAKQALVKSYSPYSGFKVASAALLRNGAMVSGANQENASYPVCICAEVAMMAACTSQYPGVPVRKIAIVSQSGKATAHQPAAPCGQCRQTLLEYEQRFSQDIALILCGENGEVYKLSSVKDLLPLYFSGADL